MSWFVEFQIWICIGTKRVVDRSHFHPRLGITWPFASVLSSTIKTSFGRVIWIRIDGNERRKELLQLPPFLAHTTHHTPHNTQHTTNTAHAANTHTTTDSLANVERPILATILYSSCSSNARSYLAPTQDTITHRKKGVAGHTSVYGLERHTTTTMASLFFTFDTSFHPVPLLATSGRSWKTTSTRKWYPYTYK